MRNIFCIFILLLLCMCNKKNKSNDNSVFGIINNAPKNCTIKLIERKGNNFNLLDSVVVNDSVFEFKIKKSKLKFYAIEVENNKFLIHFLADSGQNINFKIDYNLLKQYKVSSSKHSEIIMLMENKLDSCNRIIAEKIKNNLPYIEDIEKYRTEMIHYISEIDSSPALIIMLSQKFIDEQVVFPIEHYTDLYKNILQKLEKKYSTYDFYLILKKFVKKFDNETQQNANQSNIENVYSFKARTIDGKTFMFENYINKYLLLCFWASWQFDSYKTNIFLREIENKYKQIGIVQFALETNKKVVEDSLIKYNFNHTIIIEPMVWQSDIVKAYNIKQIPTYILIYKNKILLKTNDNKLINKKLNELF